MNAKKKQLGCQSKKEVVKKLEIESQSHNPTDTVSDSKTKPRETRQVSV